jgi:hypothetical protein
MTRKYHNVRHEGRFTTRFDNVRREISSGRQLALAMGGPIRRTVRQRLLAAMERMGVVR